MSLVTFNFSLLLTLANWTIRLIMLVYVPQRRSAAAARTWLLMIFLLPIPGLILYMIIGRIYVPRWRVGRQRRASQVIREAQKELSRPVAEVPLHLRDVARMVQGLGDFAVWAGNRIELMPGYDASINRLVADIDAARETVHLLTYIFENDATGRRVADALTRASARGVTCRVLMDDVGSKGGLNGLAPALRAAGVAVTAALPARLLRRAEKAARFDLRNHRKITVLDGCVAHTGSQNIADAEFVKDYPNEELVARVTGPVVAQLQAVFLEDWYFETDEILRVELFPDLPDAGTSAAQVLPSGPGYRRQNAYELIVHLLHEAESRIVITTPYFVPDEPFLLGLQAAVVRGVDTHLIVSEQEDQLLSSLAQRSHYDGLLEAGVKIHLYRPHFLHAKHLTIDTHIALISSINMDIRSFALNAEVGLLVYDAEVVAAVRKIQEGYLADATTLTLKEWRQRPPHTRVAQNLARLADSLL